MWKATQPSYSSFGTPVSAFFSSSKSHASSRALKPGSAFIWS
jgi:hypothetical protein